MWKDIPINNFTMKISVLKWSADDDNDSSGEIVFSLQNYQALANGKIWPKSDNKPTQDNFHGTTPSFHSPVHFWEGRYKTVLKLRKAVKTGKELEISFPPTAPSGKVTLGGKEISPISFEKTTLSWSNGTLTFYVQRKTVSNPSIAKFYGKLWEEGEEKPNSNNF